MTDELPKRDPVFCDRCNAAVRLERGQYGLKLVCACDEQRSVKVKQAFPEGWQNE